MKNCNHSNYSILSRLEYWEETWKPEKLAVIQTLAKTTRLEKLVRGKIINTNTTTNNNYNNNNNNNNTWILLENWKKLWNMKVAIIPIMISAFGRVTKGLLKGLEDLGVGGWVETIETTALLRTARILRRVLETWGDLLSLKLLWKTIS